VTDTIRPRSANAKAADAKSKIHAAKDYPGVKDSAIFAPKKDVKRDTRKGVNGSLPPR
jgi:hypothetical protein